MEIVYTSFEGGDKIQITAHSLEWPNGLRWDEKNGFTRSSRSLEDISENIVINKLMTMTDMEVLVNDYFYKTETRIQQLEKRINLLKIRLANIE